MNEYEKLKAQYQQYIVELLAQNKAILIDSFCEYYGEKYRSLIEERYNTISFTFYYENAAISRLLSDSLAIKNPKLYEKLKNMQAQRPEHYARIKEFKALYEKYGHYPWGNVIYTANEDDLDNDPATYSMSTSMTSANFFGVFNENFERKVTIPIFYIDEWDIIHEINHAITWDCLAKSESGKSIEKWGMEVSGNRRESMTEELLNDLAAKEICDIFHRRGGSFGDISANNLVGSPYNANAYLVRGVYDNFKEDIKTARISDNKNTFVERVGAHNYAELTDLVNDGYFNDLDAIAEYKVENESRAQSILANMQNYCTQENESTGTIEDYYKLLSEQGYKVTPIDDMPRK